MARYSPYGAAQPADKLGRVPTLNTEIRATLIELNQKHKGIRTYDGMNVAYSVERLFEKVLKMTVNDHKVVEFEFADGYVAELSFDRTISESRLLFRHGPPDMFET